MGWSLGFLEPGSLEGRSLQSRALTSRDRALPSQVSAGTSQGPLAMVMCKEYKLEGQVLVPSPTSVCPSSTPG